MVEIFKTHISKKNVARTLVKSLSMQFPDYKINIDLADCDKVLRVESVCFFDTDQIVTFMKSQNVKIELLS
ncbi:MAG: hypothetical protein KBF45_08660 [Cyclobacteriaceae bacterium]|jgi:hypothetical protein|nr:hypothetical protein [Cyclobacteriaceae bacterium]